MKLEKNFLEQIPDIVFELNKEGDYLDFWYHYQDIPKNSKKQILRKNIQKLLSNQTSNIILNYLKQADKEDASIVKTIQMAKSLNLRSIAEGVENKEVLNLIKEFGCDEIQGYHFAKPMNIDEFDKYYDKTFSTKLKEK